jgi:hypothetical protein
MENALDAIGILVSITGTWLFAYDLIWGYKHRIKIDQLKVKLETQKIHYEWMKNAISKYAQPPYTPAEIEKEYKENDSYNLPVIKEINDEIEKLSNSPETTAVLAVIGLVIMTAGAVLQLIAIYISKK